MKQIIKLSIACLTVVFFFAACGENRDNTQKFEKTIDSLKSANQKQEAELKDMTSFITTLSEGLNAIAVQENMLFSKDAEGNKLNKEQLKSQLAIFSNLLTEQRKRIEQLSDSLKSRGVNLARMQGLIDNLKHQLDDKDQMIAEFRRSLEQKNFDISQLQSRLSSATATNIELAQKAENAEKELAKRNTAYVLIGDEDALKEGGYIDRRENALINTMPKTGFKKVNIYDFKELVIPSRKYEICTDHPKHSYDVDRIDRHSRKLIIENPEMFWSNSRYLIIMTK